MGLAFTFSLTSPLQHPSACNSLKHITDGHLQNLMGLMVLSIQSIRPWYALQRLSKWSHRNSREHTQETQECTDRNRRIPTNSVIFGYMQRHLLRLLKTQFMIKLRHLVQKEGDKRIGYYPVEKVSQAFQQEQSAGRTFAGYDKCRYSY